MQFFRTVCLKIHTGKRQLINKLFRLKIFSESQDYIMYVLVTDVHAVNFYKKERDRRENILGSIIHRAHPTTFLV